MRIQLATLLGTATTGVLLASGLVLASPAAAAESPQAAYSRTAVTATNAARTKQKLKKTGVDSCLTGFAAAHATKLAKEKKLYHQNLKPILTKCKLKAVAENIAYGYPNGTSVVNSGWMKSTGHRKNILGGYTLVAVEARKANNGTWYAVQIFGRR